MARADRRARRGRRGRHPAMAEINVTPMVDVMLVLLVIFMVAAPLLSVGVPLKLPQSAAQAVAAEAEAPLTVSLTADGGLAILTDPVTAEDLIPALRRRLETRQSDRIFLRADGALPYAQVVALMGRLNAAGLSNLTLVTERAAPGAAN